MAAVGTHEPARQAGADHGAQGEGRGHQHHGAAAGVAAGDVGGLQHATAGERKFPQPGARRIGHKPLGRGQQGDAARQAAKKDPRGYMLFTCNSPHVFVVQDAKAKADLLKAKVVKAGEPTFADLDAKYIGNCKNPLVKSAIPAEKAPAKK